MFKKVFTIFLLVMVIPTGIHAKKPTKRVVKLAKNLYRTAKLYFDDKNYEEALHNFKKAYKLSKRAELLFNIAFCYEKLRKPKNAILYLKVYKRRFPQESLVVDKKINQLTKMFNNSFVNINGGIVGSVVLIDGKISGKLPLKKPVRVIPNVSHEIIVKSKHSKSFQRTVTVKAGRTLVVTVSLKVKETENPKIFPKLKISKRQNVIIKSVDEKKHETSFEISTGRKSAIIIIGILGGASLIAGSVSGYLALDSIKKYDEAKEDGLVDDLSSHEDDARLYAHISDGAFLFGAVAISTAAIIYFTSPKKSSNSLAVFPILYQSQEGTSVALGISGRF
jgi:tetratricopeptide (TPR) repeat protein